MYLYILITSYPYEGGHIHGVFSTYEKAEQAMNSNGFDYGCIYTFIEKVKLNAFEFNQVDV